MACSEICIKHKGEIRPIPGCYWHNTVLYNRVVVFFTGWDSSQLKTRSAWGMDAVGWTETKWKKNTILLSIYSIPSAEVLQGGIPSSCKDSIQALALPNVCWVIEWIEDEFLFHTQEPVPITLGSRFVWKSTKRRRKIVCTRDIMYYVPLLDSLKVQICSSCCVHDTVFSWVLAPISGKACASLWLLVRTL